MADIVIRGMEMPKEPTNITIYPDGAWCDYTTNDQHGKFVILPEGHGRLIDADALVADTSFFDGGDWHYGYSAKQIQNAPTILEAEGGLRNDS